MDIHSRLHLAHLARLPPWRKQTQGNSCWTMQSWRGGSRRMSKEEPHTSSSMATIKVAKHLTRSLRRGSPMKNWLAGCQMRNMRVAWRRSNPHQQIEIIGLALMVHLDWSTSLLVSLEDLFKKSEERPTALGALSKEAEQAAVPEGPRQRIRNKGRSVAQVMFSIGPFHQSFWNKHAPWLSEACECLAI